MPSKRSTTEDTLYLTKIGQRWHARIPVPSVLRPKLGPYIRRALGTTDLREAQRRRWDVKRLVDERFDRELAKLHTTLNPSQAAYRQWRSTLSLTDGGTVDLPVTDPVSGEVFGYEQVNHGLEDTLEMIQRLPPDHEAHRAASDHLNKLLPVSELVDHYLKHNPKRSKDTQALYATVSKTWTAAHGDKSLSPRWVTRKIAATWHQKATQGKARGTALKYARAMKQLWDWQYRHEDVVPANPFEQLSKASGTAGTTKAEHYTPLEDSEIVSIAGVSVVLDRELYPVILTSAYSGMRLSECLSAKRETVNGIECFKVGEGKTAAASRLVPVHHLLKDVKLETELSPKALSVRFGRLKKSLGITDSTKVFHSLRKSFTTKLEQAGCPENVAVRLLGHAPVSMSYRVYSGGQHVQELKRWVDQVQYQGITEEDLID